MDVVNVAYIQDLIEAHHYTLGQLEVKSGISKAQWSRILAYKRGVGSRYKNHCWRDASFP